MADGSFSERARQAIIDRGHGMCQRCFGMPVHEVHHRLPRGKGGTSVEWVGWPSNGLGLCSTCHRWVEYHRACAEERGLLLRHGQRPSEVPVWLRLPYGEGWYLLHDDGTVGWAHERWDGGPPVACA